MSCESGPRRGFPRRVFSWAGSGEEVGPKRHRDTEEIFLLRDLRASSASSALKSFLNRGGPRRVHLADKSRNLALLGRHLGLFPRTAPGKSPEGEGAAGDAGAVRELSDTELGQEICGILFGGR